MRKITVAVALFCAAAFGSVSAWAQEQTMSPPKVLEIQREFGKFGKDTSHQKNEMAYAQAEAEAKSPTHYFAATAASGTGEAWFFIPFASFADYEKSTALQLQPAMQARLAGVIEREAELVSNGSTWLASYDDKSSYHPNVNIAQMRYFEVETIRTRMGHDKDWEELVKLFSSTLDKANLDVHYAVYNVVYGAPAGTVLIFTPHKSLGELDSMSANFDKAFSDALGPDGQKRMAQLTEAAIATDVNNLFAFDPKMSYPPEEWVQADSFWKPAKAMPKAAKAMAKKPAPATQP